MPTMPPSALATAARASLGAFFASSHHNPSPEHWAALGDVLGTLDAMAAGTAAPQVFVGALDPGVGKSSAVLAFARALMASRDHRDVGMVVCVGRIAEAEAMAKDLQAPGASFAVLTSQEAANALSTADPADAQVLITTQQRIEAATAERGFAAVEAFHYRGVVRQVRVWDEAWLPGEAVTVTGDDLLGVVKPIRARSDTCATAVRTFAISLDAATDGAAVQVPDFEAEHGMTFLDVLMDLGAAGKPRDDVRATVKALARITGKVARVKSEGQGRGTVLTYHDTLPADLAPLLVLDASARVRRTYEFIERHRGGMVRLREAVKDYTPLTVHVWDTSGSKSGWERQGKDLVDGIAEAIMERPDEPWLVVHHKRAGKAPATDGAIRRKLGKDIAARVQFITWGNHMASNAFAEVPNVVLAGTLFMRPSHYVATTHLAQGLQVAQGLAPADDVRSVTIGEHANLVLQAICRGRVRKSDGARCQPMRAYVIASPRSGIRAALPAIFPGCQVVTWRGEVDVKPQGKLGEALGFIDAERAKGAHVIPFASIRDHLHIARPNLTKLVTGKPLWVTEIQRRGLETYGGQGRPGGVKVA